MTRWQQRGDLNKNSITLNLVCLSLGASSTLLALLHLYLLSSAVLRVLHEYRLVPPLAVGSNQRLYITKLSQADSNESLHYSPFNNRPWVVLIPESPSEN